MIKATDLQYLGAVRTPDNGFPYGGYPASVDLLRKHYVIGGKDSKLGRVTMVRPQLPKVRPGFTDRRVLDPTSVPTAPWVDIPVLIDPSNKAWHELNKSDNAADGSLAEVCVVGNKAIVAGQIYYDAGATQDVSFLVCDWPLTQPVKRTPWKSVQNLGEGWAAGPMTIIPTRWREALKGDVLFGQPGGLPIISRQSYGPCAITARASDFLDKQDIPANLLLGYANGQLAYWEQGANDFWNSCTSYTSCTFVGDYLLFIGTHGYGVPKYGKGTRDITLDGKIDPSDGGRWVYDPTGSAKGTHAYPYRVQALAYRVTDLADVAAGRKKHHEIQPAFWLPINVPHFDHEHYQPPPEGTLPRISIGGAEFDSESCELHLCAIQQDSNGWEPGPLWHVYKVHGIAPVPNPVIDLDVAAPTPELERLRARITELTAETLELKDRIATLLADLKYEQEMHRLTVNQLKDIQQRVESVKAAIRMLTQ